MNIKELFDEVSKATCKTSQLAVIHAHGTDGKAGSVYAAMAAVVGSLQILGATVSEYEGEPSSGDLDISKRITDDTVMFAALFTCCCMSIGKAPNGNPDTIAVEIEFSPANFLQAANMFQKLTGRTADPFLCRSMLRDARKQIDAGTNAASDLLNTICANYKPA